MPFLELPFLELRVLVELVRFAALRERELLLFARELLVFDRELPVFERELLLPPRELPDFAAALPDREPDPARAISFSFPGSALSRASDGLYPVSPRPNVNRGSSAR